MRRHAHVDFQLFSQKSSGIPDNCIRSAAGTDRHLHAVLMFVHVLWKDNLLLQELMDILMIMIIYHMHHVMRHMI